MPKLVFIPAAGTGSRMGERGKIINKALLPVGGKAVISEIIEMFPPDSEFVIALGYKRNQIKQYLNISHPNKNIKYIEVDRFEGEGTGPGYTLNFCKALLSRPFYFISCDTIIKDFVFPSETHSWMGCVPVGANPQAYSHVLTNSDGAVVEIVDKEIPPLGAQTFSGFAFIKDPEVFFKGLASNSNVKSFEVKSGFRELAINESVLSKTVRWTDVGTEELYQDILNSESPYDFSKINEFIYFEGQRVIKFFSDEKITSARVKKAGMATKAFPLIDIQSGQFYSYKMIPGVTLYKDLNPKNYNAVLEFLVQDFWKAKEITAFQFEKDCEKFYRNKTLERVNLFLQKKPSFDSVSSVNGVNIKEIESYLKKIDWSAVYRNSKAYYFHGDLQPDNIIICADGDSKIKLIDWRQDFAGQVEYGDIQYDFAKMLGGLLLDYTAIKQNKFSVRIENNLAVIDVPSVESKETYIEMLKSTAAGFGLNWQGIETMVALIFLNMSPLHTPPFDEMLFLYAKKIFEKGLG